MRKLFTFVLLLVMYSVPAFSAEAKKRVWFTEPKDGATVTNPVTFCYAEEGLKVVEWQRDNIDGQGHHHLLLDIDFPTTPDYKGIKDPLLIVHFRKKCKTLRKPLSKGKHTIRGFFTHNNHRPYLPIIGTTISITVK